MKKIANAPDNSFQSDFYKLSYAVEDLLETFLGDSFEFLTPEQAYAIDKLDREYAKIIERRYYDKRA